MLFQLLNQDNGNNDQESAHPDTIIAINHHHHNHTTNSTAHLDNAGTSGQEGTDEFSSSFPNSGRSSASSPEQRSPPRGSPTSYTISNSTHSTHRGNRQPTQQDMELADTVRDLLREPQFREMLIYNCPHVCSRLLTLV
ncbi:hypothetical protein CAEBREN_12437 [Caenorhabditis brenneri]|uniref:Uncharacterized protein n=1 Tax=Caenorhabditis brenneri TaxID=135651 RepID=G0NNT2_CAEBE|nr:hypothetical protein CAEBREN_12437 [Caenorhabditis brenneri]